MRELRKARGLSQEELAHRVGIHSTYLGGVERGERDPALVNIGRIAKGLRVPLAELFSVFSGQPAATEARTARRPPTRKRSSG